MKFDEVDLIEPIRTALKKIGVSEMTEIQEKAIPILFQKKEVIAKAPTGTGKTYAFGIPIITEIDPELEATQALILCPTRELCTQLRDEMRALSQDMPQIHVAAVYGGQPIRRQIEALQKNPQIVVATPGRLIDHYKHRNIRLNRVAVTILDEADEMLDMGFFKDVRFILDQLPKRNRLSMFSATISRPVMDIGWLYQRDPAEIVVEPVKENKPKIAQFGLRATGTQKILDLMQLVRVVKPERAIIFCNTKYQTGSLCDQLVRKGFFAKCIHGDMAQPMRNKIMNEYKAGGFQLLVVTDVAARGIDITGVDAVINFDVPQENEYYIHRIGRTGRAKQEGKAYTFFWDNDKAHLDDILHYTKSEMRYLKFDENGELTDA